MILHKTFHFFISVNLEFPDQLKKSEGGRRVQEAIITLPSDLDQSPPEELFQQLEDVAPSNACQTVLTEILEEQ